jgi:hypothetical protein
MTDLVKAQTLAGSAIAINLLDLLYEKNLISWRKPVLSSTGR